MSVLTNIRNRTGLLLIVIAGALILFLVQGIASSSTSLFSSNQRVVGEILGQEIEDQRFIALVDELSSNFTKQQGRTPDENTLRSIREQAWKQILFEIAYTEQMNDLGIVVTKGGEESEEVDMIQGRYIHPSIIQQFTDPQTGKFEKTKLIQVLQNLAEAPEDQQEYVENWKAFERGLIQDRLRSKYENLFTKTNFVTTAEAKRSYASTNDSVQVAYLYVPFTSIADSTIEITDQELSSYLNENSNAFEVEAGRTFEYVSFNVQATPEDINDIREKAAGLAEQFKTTPNDTAFIRSRADNPAIPRYVSFNEVPFMLKRDSLALTVKDTVLGPFSEGKKFTVYKVLDFNEADTIQKATASHILVRSTDEQGQPLSPEALAQAKARAESLLQRALGGEDFAELAKAESADGSAQKGGDLGEFKTGQMVPPFQNAVFNAKKEGVVAEVIESRFGFHIINVTKKAVIDEINPKFLIGAVDKEIYPSHDTKNAAFKQATAFLSSCNGTAEGFAKAVEADSSLFSNEAKNINGNASRFGGVQDGRQVVKWAFNDETEVGAVSDVFRLENSFVVAALTNAREKGKASVNDVKEDLEIAVRKQKKADAIIAILEKNQGADFQVRMEAINSSEGAGFATKNFSPVKINMQSSYVSALGNEPKFVGTAFGIEKGKWSEKIIGESGVYIVELKDKTVAPEVADYTQQKTQIANQFGGYFVKGGIEKVIEDNSDVKDYRYKFY